VGESNGADSSAIEWLLDSDPAIRWQTLRDLRGASLDVVAAERARVATEGWGAELLGRQAADGTFGGDLDNPEWTVLLTLLWLQHMGLDPQSDAARRAVAPVRDKVTWHWWDNRPFFHGEVEPCINGRVLGLAAYYGQDSGDLVPRLLGEQMADGGWNCEQENGATVGSFHTTINVLEGLAAYERTGTASAEVTEARSRGQEYLLERKLLRRLTTGELIDPEFSQLSFPTGYHYDVLRALDHMRLAAVAPDERMTEALDIIRSKRRDDGRWNLENPHPDQLDIEIGERDGKPSRWITLRAMRVVRWAEERPGMLGG
jgi:hypothetical protein